MLRCSSEAIKRNDKYPQNVNLYVTNYEDVVNCYALTDLNKVIKVDKDNEELWHQYNCKKIILTTDQNLVNDLVNEVDDEFLEWFCSKNGKVNFVETECEDDPCINCEWNWDSCPNASVCLNRVKYKTIIPKDTLVCNCDATSIVSRTCSTDKCNCTPTDEQTIDNQDFLQQLKDYFKNTPREKVLEDWAKSAEFDNVGPTVDDFIAESNNNRILALSNEMQDKWFDFQSKHAWNKNIDLQSIFEAFIFRQLAELKFNIINLQKQKQ